MLWTKSGIGRYAHCSTGKVTMLENNLENNIEQNQHHVRVSGGENPKEFP
jgi:hypothetical protein